MRIPAQTRVPATWKHKKAEVKDSNRSFLEGEFFVC